MVTVVAVTLLRVVSVFAALKPRFSIAPEILFDPVPPRETGTIVAINLPHKKFLYIDIIQELNEFGNWYFC